MQAPRGICTCLAVILLTARPAISQSAQDTVDVEVAAARALLDQGAAGAPRRRFIIDSAIMKREAAPGYAVGARTTQHMRRLSEALGAPYMSRDEAVSCDGAGCRLQGATAMVRLSEVRFDRDGASVTVTIDRQGPDRVVNGTMRARLDYETVHFEFRRDVMGWKLIRATQLGIS